MRWNRINARPAAEQTVQDWAEDALELNRLPGNSIAHMSHALRSFYLRSPFFYALGALVLLFALAFVKPALLLAAQVLLALLALIIIYNIFVLYMYVGPVSLQRALPKKLALGEDNAIAVQVYNGSQRPLNIKLVEELPEQLQVRDFTLSERVASREMVVLNYHIKPLCRGEYSFGASHLFVRGPLGLSERRISFDNRQNRPVYPSIPQMQRMELKALTELSRGQGLRKIRRIGHSYEFEQIKNYVMGDDLRSINWKATSRAQNLMVNQYEDERSQPVYCLIDCGRSMQEPFGGMTLLDYAINASLSLINVILKKNDLAGLLCFDQRIQVEVQAQRKRTQLGKVLEALYKLSEHEGESNYELLYNKILKVSPHRSLLILFSNYETEYALQRNLMVLRKLQMKHMVLLILFENSEINETAHQDSADVEAIYRRAIAADFLLQKKQMAKIAAKAGIQTLLTRPENLTLSAINKYLELKARGLI